MKPLTDFSSEKQVGNFYTQWRNALSERSPSVCLVQTPVLIHRPPVTRHGIFLSWCALKSFLSAQWSSMAREDTRATRHVALLCLLVCCGHVLAQDVADCTWQPHQDEAVESSSLECHLKTLQTGPAVIPQVCHPNNPLWPSVVYLLVSLAPALNVWEGAILLSRTELSCIQTQPRLFTRHFLVWVLD